MGPEKDIIELLDKALDLSIQIDKINQTKKSKSLDGLKTRAFDLYQDLGELLIVTICSCPSLNKGVTGGVCNNCKQPLK